MKKTTTLLLLLLTLFTACDDTETYSDKKEKERDAINDFIKTNHIRVINESVFNAHQQMTDTATNEYVYIERSGVYLQIVRKGCGTMLEEKKQVNLLCRYTEYNILNKTEQTANIYAPRQYDKMTVTRTGATYTASFTSGVMYSSYGASVPAGWLVPLQFIYLGRQSTADDEIARVRIIVPHSQGHSYASSSVYPCYYDITYQREK